MTGDLAYPYRFTNCVLYYKEKNYDKAIEAYRKAIEINSLNDPHFKSYLSFLEKLKSIKSQKDF